MNYDFYLEEEGFRAQMQRQVEPFLRDYRKDGYMDSYDGTKIHYNTFILPEPKANIVISHGFSEFIEKYNEMIYYFLKNNFSVYILEYRGHGYSDREVEDLDKVHVEKFEEYILDLHFFMKRIVEFEGEKKINDFRNIQKILESGETLHVKREKNILFAHSMGGGIGTLYLEEHPHMFDAAVLSSPMLQMQTGKYPMFVAELAAGFSHLVGKGTHFAAGQQKFNAQPRFAESSCLSEERYYYTFGKRLKDPHYQTWGGSYDWVRAAIKASKFIRKKRNIAQIQIPVLVFEAGLDTMVNNKAIEAFAQKAENVQLVKVPEAKHEIFHAGERERRRFYRKLVLFLEEQVKK